MEKKKKETKAKFLIFSFNLSMALQTTLDCWILSQFPPSKFQNWAAPFKYSTQPNPSHSQVISPHSPLSKQRNIRALLDSYKRTSLHVLFPGQIKLSIDLATLTFFSFATMLLTKEPKLLPSHLESLTSYPSSHTKV